MACQLTIIVFLVALADFSLAQFEEQINHGLEAAENQFPFHAVIMDPNGDMTCGGTFISRRHVLTAAHCVQVWSKSDITIYGAMISIDDEKKISADVSRIDVHPNYDSQYFRDDIAIVTLVSDIEDRDGRRIRAMKLPEQDEKYPINACGLTLGFGETQDGNMSTKLLFARERLVSPSVCNIYSNFRSEAMICAFNSRSESCRSDSGGGLVVKQKLVGVLTYGFGHACGSHQTAVYVKVSAYINWIRGITNYEPAGVTSTINSPTTSKTPSLITSKVTVTPVTAAPLPVTGAPLLEARAPISITRPPQRVMRPPLLVTRKPIPETVAQPPVRRPVSSMDDLVLPFSKADDPQYGSFRGWSRYCNGNREWAWSTNHPATTHTYDCSCTYKANYERGTRHLTQAEPYGSCQKNIEGPADVVAKQTPAVTRAQDERSHLGQYRGKSRSCKGIVRTRGNIESRQCICKYTENYEKGNYVYKKDEPYDELCAQAQPLTG